MSADLSRVEASLGVREETGHGERESSGAIQSVTVFCQGGGRSRVLLLYLYPSKYIVIKGK